MCEKSHHMWRCLELVVVSFQQQNFIAIDVDTIHQLKSVLRAFFCFALYRQLLTDQQRVCAIFLIIVKMTSRAEGELALLVQIVFQPFALNGSTSAPSQSSNADSTLNHAHSFGTDHCLLIPSDATVGELAKGTLHILFILF